VKRFLVSCIAVAAVGWPAWGQKVETEKADKGKIVHVQTALDHLTVLEMGEPVSAVAVGSSSFRVEWRGDKVFIEPIEPGAATNLFVWTRSGRFNYELDPPGAVPEMIFAIDQAAPNPPKIKIARKEMDNPTDPSPDEVLMDMTPVRLMGPDSRKNGIAVFVTDILARDGQILIRYSIRNGTNRVYMPGSPQVALLRAPRYRQSLYTLRDRQLSLRESPRLRSDGAIRVEVTKAETHPEIKPGERASGIVTIKLPSVNSEPAVLQLNFLAGPGGPVRATVVL
jgi:hypothetical protein